MVGGIRLRCQFDMNQLSHRTVRIAKHRTVICLANSDESIGRGLDGYVDRGAIVFIGSTGRCYGSVLLRRFMAAR